jgi:hypothetical protein
MHLIPLLAILSILSLNGKKASDKRIESLISPEAFVIAMSTESTRLT